MPNRSAGEWLLHLEQEMQIDPEAAYDAFTDPELLSKWFTESAKADLRVGGRYSNSDKDQGEYLLLERPGHVRFTWENEEHCPGTVVDVKFRKVSGTETAMVLEHRDIKDESGHEDMKMGWSWALDSLKSFLEHGKPIPFDEWEGGRNE